MEDWQKRHTKGTQWSSRRRWNTTCVLIGAAEKMSYKGLYSMKQVWEMRYTKGTSKSPQALPPVKHTSLPPFYCLPNTKTTKQITLNFLLVTIFFFFRSAEKACSEDNNKSYSDILDRNMLEWQLARQKQCLTHHYHRIQVGQPTSSPTFFPGVSTSPALSQ